MKNKFKIYHYALFLILGIFMLQISCSKKKSDDSSDAAATSISGAAILGPVSDATVTVYPVLSADGSLDTANPLASGKTNSDGSYSIDLPAAPSGAVGVQITGGSYVEEATGATVSLGSKSFTTLLPSVSAGAATNAALGPLPEMAYQRFKTQMASGVPSGSSMAELATNANYAVSQAFGISDIVGVIPANTYGSIPNDATGQYALVMAALSKSAANAGVDSAALAQAYAANFKGSGVFNPAAVTVTTAAGASVSVTPPTLSNFSSTVSDIGKGNIAMNGVVPPAGFTPPTMNPVPPTVAPPTYVPGSQPTLEISQPSQSVSAVSCSVGSVVGSITRNVSVGGSTMITCVDFVGSSYSQQMLKSMCPDGMQGCSVSASSCASVNASGYVGGCRQGKDSASDQIQRYYNGFSAEQVSGMCNSDRPACSSGT